MTSKLKTLGLALAVAGALGAVAAPAAPAQDQQFHSESGSGTTYLTTENLTSNEIILDTPSGQIKCTQFSAGASYGGKTAMEITFTNVQYFGCTAFGLETSVDKMGCDFKLVRKDATTGITHLECPTTGGGVTDQITITPLQGGAPICHINVTEQTIKTKVENTATTVSPHIPDDIDLIADTTDWIEYTVERTAGGSKCPSQGFHNDATFTGTTTVTAFEDAAHTKRTGLTYKTPM